MESAAGGLHAVSSSNLSVTARSPWQKSSQGRPNPLHRPPPTPGKGGDNRSQPDKGVRVSSLPQHRMAALQTPQSLRSLGHGVPGVRACNREPARAVVGPVLKKERHGGSIPHQTRFRQGRWSRWVDIRTDTLPTKAANWGSSPASEVTHPDPGLSERSAEKLGDVTCLDRTPRKRHQSEPLPLPRDQLAWCWRGDC